MGDYRFINSIKELAREALHLNKIPSAINYYQQSIRLQVALFGENSIRFMNYLSSVIEEMYKVGMAYLNSGKLQKSITTFKCLLQIVPESCKSQFSSEMSSVLNALAEAYRKNHQCLESKETLKRAMKFASSGMDSNLGSIYLTLSELYSEMNQPQKSIVFCKKSIEIIRTALIERSNSENSELVNHLAKAYYRLAIQYENTGKVEISLKWYRESIIMLKSSNEKVLLSQCVSRYKQAQVLNKTPEPARRVNSFSLLARHATDSSFRKKMRVSNKLRDLSTPNDSSQRISHRKSKSTVVNIRSKRAKVSPIDISLVTNNTPKNEKTNKKKFNIRNHSRRTPSPSVRIVAHGTEIGSPLSPSELVNYGVTQRDGVHDDKKELSIIHKPLTINTSAKTRMNKGLNFTSKYSSGILPDFIRENGYGTSAVVIKRYTAGSDADASLLDKVDMAIFHRAAILIQARVKSYFTRENLKLLKKKKSKLISRCGKGSYIVSLLKSELMEVLVYYEGNTYRKVACGNVGLDKVNFSEESGIEIENCSSKIWRHGREYQVEYSKSGRILNLVVVANDSTGERYSLDIEIKEGKAMSEFYNALIPRIDIANGQLRILDNKPIEEEIISVYRKNGLRASRDKRSHTSKPRSYVQCQGKVIAKIEKHMQNNLYLFIIRLLPSLTDISSIDSMMVSIEGIPIQEGKMLEVCVEPLSRICEILKIQEDEIYEYRNAIFCLIEIQGNCIILSEDTKVFRQLMFTTQKVMNNDSKYLVNVFSIIDDNKEAVIIEAIEQKHSPPIEKQLVISLEEIGEILGVAEDEVKTHLDKLTELVVVENGNSLGLRTRYFQSNEMSVNIVNCSSEIGNPVQIKTDQNELISETRERSAETVSLNSLVVIQQNIRKYLAVIECKLIRNKQNNCYMLCRHTKYVSGRYCIVSAFQGIPLQNLLITVTDINTKQDYDLTVAKGERALNDILDEMLIKNNRLMLKTDNLSNRDRNLLNKRQPTISNSSPIQDREILTEKTKYLSNHQYTILGLLEKGADKLIFEVFCPLQPKKSLAVSLQAASRMTGIPLANTKKIANYIINHKLSITANPLEFTKEHSINLNLLECLKKSKAPENKTEIIMNIREIISNMYFTVIFYGNTTLTIEATNIAQSLKCVLNTTIPLYSLSVQEKEQISCSTIEFLQISYIEDIPRLLLRKTLEEPNLLYRKIHRILSKKIQISITSDAKGTYIETPERKFLIFPEQTANYFDISHSIDSLIQTFTSNVISNPLL